MFVAWGSLLSKRIDEWDHKAMSDAASALRAGELVAFPTETVYGLGANASSSEAVGMVYQVKGRPATDPLIVHVTNLSAAQRIVDQAQMNDWQRAALRVLAEQFWPGPLTLVLPADLSQLAGEVTSGTGWVGIRQPAHPVAERFLKLCSVPVAAPSANLFGHVSPTTAEHVLVDFPNVDKLWIVDGGRCGFGIESTVVRINKEETLDVLRRGGVGPSQLRNALVHSDLLDASNITAVTVIDKYAVEKEKNSLFSPGQRLVHYAPKIETVMVSLSDAVSDDFQQITPHRLKDLIVLDFGGYLKNASHIVGHYRDLSSSEDVREAAFVLFDSLRWAETIAGESGILWIANLRRVIKGSDELGLALVDRVVRAAAGRTAEVSFKQDSGRVSVSIR